MAVAIVSGIALSLILGLGSGLSGQVPGLVQQPAAEVWHSLAPQTGRSLLYQLGAAAFLEEPLFRGFLWGYLRRARWKDGWVWLAQAGLFTLGHLYYINHLWFSLLVIVPCGSLLLGWLAWRSRSIAPGMLAHSIMNTITFPAAQIRW